MSALLVIAQHQSATGSALGSIQSVPGVWWIIFAAVIAHESWRWLGLWIGSRVSVDGQVFQWVQYVAMALVAALVMRLVLFPAGALADVDLIARCAALAIGVGTYLATRRNLAMGVAVGSLSLAAFVALT
ncbi:MAG: AzlD domain-containing protein [Pseudomonadota bacterium]